MTLKLFRAEATFIAGATRPSLLPKLSLPEIAFIGKSNVGKSSLINSICGRKSLARTSHTPGRTQQINFFSLGDKLILVDLPGYGFAKVPKEVKREWERLMITYLQGRENLQLVNLLVDARHGLKENDIYVAKLLLEYKRNFQIVFTKADKVNSLSELVKMSKNSLMGLGCFVNVVCTSSRRGHGIKELQYSLAEACKQ